MTQRDPFSTQTIRARFASWCLTPKTGGPRLMDGATPLERSAAIKRAAQVRGLLRSVGLGVGDRLALAIEDDREAVAVLLACFLEGIAAVLMTPDMAPPEAQAVLGVAQPRAAIVAASAAEAWFVAGAYHPEQTWRVTAEKKKVNLVGRLLGRRNRDPSAQDPEAYPSVLERHDPCAAPQAEVDAETVALILCTSGSTAAPKLVPLTLRNLIAQAETMGKRFEIEASSRVINISPMIHVDGATGAFMAMWTSSTLVRIPFSIPRLQDYLDGIYRYRVTHALVVPTLLALLTRLGEDLRGAFDTPDFKLVISTAAPLSEHLWSEFEQVTGKRVVNMFGLTEVGNVLFAGPDDTSHQIGTMGVAVDCEARVIDERGCELEDGEAGELAVRGNCMMPGYLGPKPSVGGHLEIDGETWFSTGDIVTRDAQGIFRLAGRRKSIIITGGRNIYPEEVDEALLAHPEVVHAATVSMPDEVWGEIVVSVVVSRSAALTAERLSQHAASQLSPYKVPREIHLWDDLPKGATGKIQRAEIVKRLEAGRSSDPARSRREVSAQVLALAATTFGVPESELSLSSGPNTTRTWDSLAHLRFVLAIEQAFSMTLANTEITAIDSIEAAARVVQRKLNA